MSSLDTQCTLPITIIHIFVYWWSYDNLQTFPSLLLIVCCRSFLDTSPNCSLPGMTLLGLLSDTCFGLTKDSFDWESSLQVCLFIGCACWLTESWNALDLQQRWPQTCLLWHLCPHSKSQPNSMSTAVLQLAHVWVCSTYYILPCNAVMFHHSQWNRKLYI